MTKQHAPNSRGRRSCRTPKAIATAQDASRNSDPAPDERARIVSLLSPIPVSIDDLIRLSQMPPRIVRMVLLELAVCLAGLTLSERRAKISQRKLKTFHVL